MRQLLRKFNNKLISLLQSWNIIGHPSSFNLDKIDLSQPFNLDQFIYLASKLYNGKSGYICELNREDPELTKKNIFLTYGEILPQGLARLFDFVKPTAADAFVDLGSGAGKTVLQSFLCTDMRGSFGVEIDGARHKVAHDVLLTLQQKAPELFHPNKNIEFLNTNLMEFDFNQVTLVFANSTCYGGNLIATIIDKINKNPNIRAVMTTKQLAGLVYLTKSEMVPIETSWHVPPSKSNCYVYYK